jgi:PAS domain S-box-containing protein
MLKKKVPPPQKTPETPAERAAGTDSTFRLFFECTPVATVIIEEDGLISHANQKFSELSGFPLLEIDGKKYWKEFVAPEDYERLASYHREILKRGDGSRRFPRLGSLEGRISLFRAFCVSGGSMEQRR